jgi:hypothetical protein
VTSTSSFLRYARNICCTLMVEPIRTRRIGNQTLQQFFMGRPRRQDRRKSSAVGGASWGNEKKVFRRILLFSPFKARPFVSANRSIECRTNSFYNFYILLLNLSTKEVHIENHPAESKTRLKKLPFLLLSLKIDKKTR